MAPAMQPQGAALSWLVAPWLCACTLWAATAPISGEKSCASDELTLLQVHNASAAAHTKTKSPKMKPCYGYPVMERSQCQPLFNKSWRESKTFGWWSLPKQDLDGLSEQMTEVTNMSIYPPAAIPFMKQIKVSLVGAAEGAKMLYQATKVEPLFPEVPKLFRGVFWMRNNAVAEELAVLQYGKWFPDEDIYVAALAPMSWAWPAGKPKRAPQGGIMYSEDMDAGAQRVASFAFNAGGISFKMGPCPSYAACNGTSNMSFGYMQTHSFGELDAVDDIGGAVSSFVPIPSWANPKGVFTLEAVPRSRGNVWKRDCRWGIGRCAALNVGSYDLVRIIDEHGTPIQPYFDDFVSYMGGVELMVWSGFADEQSRERLASTYRRV